RAANGGDSSARQDIVPFRQADLPFFSTLKRRGMATGVAAVTDDRGIAYHGTRTYPVIIGVVDPAQFPLVGQPNFTRPSHGDLHRLLSSPSATVLSTAAADGLHVTLSDRITLHGANGRTLT